MQVMVHSETEQLLDDEVGLRVAENGGEAQGAQRCMSPASRIGGRRIGGQGSRPRRPSRGCSGHSPERGFIRHLIFGLLPDVLSPAEPDSPVTESDAVCPTILFCGETGAGKTTAIHRACTPMDKDRADFLNEGEGAQAGTEKTEAMGLSWQGDDSKPVTFIDMPGLNDPEGKDSNIIKEACCYLLNELKPPVIHQVVLVVCGLNPRLTKSLREIIRVLRDVFDSDGKAGFIEQLSVMFTKFPYSDWSFKTPAEFEMLVEKKKGAISTSWRVELEKFLNLSADQAEALQRRFLFVNNALPPELLAHLEKQFGLQVDLGLTDIYLRALRSLRSNAPFRLTALNPEVQTSEEERLDKAMEAEDWLAGALECMQQAVGDEPHNDEDLSAIVEKPVAELECIASGLSEKQLSRIHAKLGAMRTECQRYNFSVSENYLYQLVVSIVQQCDTDIKICKSAAQKASNPHKIYHEFFISKSGAYVERFEREKKGADEAQRAPLAVLERHVQARVEGLRKEMVDGWFASADKDMRQACSGKPHTEDNLEAITQKFFGEPIANFTDLASFFSEPMLSETKARFDKERESWKQRNHEASKKHNSDLVDTILKKCDADIIAVQAAAHPQTAYHQFLHSKQEPNSYMDLFIAKVAGVTETSYEPFDRLKRQVKSRIEHLRDKIFGAEFIRRQVAESRLGSTTRRCTHCRIAWTKEAGCEHVRCGHSEWNGSKGEVLVPKPRGRHSKVHGCGFFVDWNTAPPVAEEETAEFFKVCPQTIKAEVSQMTDRNMRQPMIPRQASMIPNLFQRIAGLSQPR